MPTVTDLREYCNQLHNNRENELKTVLSNYFEHEFISGHKPWKAVIGNKRCKPIPIHRSIRFFSEKSTAIKAFYWPNLSEDLIRKNLENLGFVVTEHKISVAVPPCENGKELTFAQEWVNKINKSYMEYCNQDLRHGAKELYSNIISQLFSTQIKDTKTYAEYTLFIGFEPVILPTQKRYKKRVKTLMARDGIKYQYRDGEYVGLMVLHQNPTN